MHVVGPERPTGAGRRFVQRGSGECCVIGCDPKVLTDEGLPENINIGHGIADSFEGVRTNCECGARGAVVSSVERLRIDGPLSLSVRRELDHICSDVDRKGLPSRSTHAWRVASLLNG